MKKVRKAVITAAGWGTRFLPITKSLPKEMLPVVNKPLIQYSVDEAVACGVETVVIVTGVGKRIVKNYFGRSLALERMLEQKGEIGLAEQMRRLSRMVDIRYVYQRQALGLGHAVLTTKHVVGDEPFLLLLPDDILERGELVLKQMINIYQNYQSSVIALKRVDREEISRYGIIEPRRISECIYQIMNLIEKPQPEEAPSDLAIVGRYILTPQIFAALENIAPGRNQEIQLTDALQRLRHQQPIYGYEFEGERCDAGTPLGWLETTITLALKDPVIGPKLRDYLNHLRRQFHIPAQQFYSNRSVVISGVKG